MACSKDGYRDNSKKAADHFAKLAKALRQSLYERKKQLRTRLAMGDPNKEDVAKPPGEG